MRQPLTYASPGVPLHVGGFDPDVPVAGYYRIRLVRGAVWSAVHLWYGPPVDPDTGEEMDRSYRWQARVNGIIADDITRIWPRCAEDMISWQQYDLILGRNAEHDPNRAIDWLTLELPFGGEN